jgi:hypothetical protein
MPTGYLHPEYAKSLSEFGTPIHLPASEGWVLKRAIEGTSEHDAMGCYPLFCCTNWSGLRQDVEALRNDLVSVVLVTDPLGDYSPELLANSFDRVEAFKDHFVVRTGRPLRQFVSTSHSHHAMRALRDVEVELCAEPLEFTDDWERLFSVLTTRHSIKGERRFSRAAFEKQVAIPGMVMFRAVVDQRTVGLDLWYVQGDCAQGHLAAFDSVGYELRASYATKWRVIEYFSDRVTWINLGAGLTRDGQDGLSRFKRGWATGTMRAWLCGRVLQPEKYASLARTRGALGEGYFPAYRWGEFA